MSPAEKIWDSLACPIFVLSKNALQNIAKASPTSTLLYKFAATFDSITAYCCKLQGPIQRLQAKFDVGSSYLRENILNEFDQNVLLRSIVDKISYWSIAICCCFKKCYAREEVQCTDLTLGFE